MLSMYTDEVVGHRMPHKGGRPVPQRNHPTGRSFRFRVNLMLDPDIDLFLDDLAAAQQVSRSEALNRLLRDLKNRLGLTISAVV